MQQPKYVLFTTPSQFGSLCMSVCKAAYLFAFPLAYVNFRRLRLHLQILVSPFNVL